jgi:hypothetical protein
MKRHCHSPIENYNQPEAVIFADASDAKPTASRQTGQFLLATRIPANAKFNS